VFLLVGLCTAACMLARGFMASVRVLFERHLETPVSGLRCSFAAGGRPLAARGFAPQRGQVVDRCARVLLLVAEVSERYRVQRSHSGCGRSGGRGPSSSGGSFRRGREMMPGGGQSGNGESEEGPEEGYSLVEGVRDCRSYPPSRAGGGHGLGQVTRCLHCADWRHGR
jgi:uncharacterized membrane protein YgcG